MIMDSENTGIESAYVGNSISLNVPSWFENSDFLEWLNGSENLMTWHKKGESADDFSDTVVFVDPGLSGDGSENGTMPTVFWDAIVKVCKSQFKPSNGSHITVILTNLDF